MKFCQNCGLENADDAAACTGCKAALRATGSKPRKRSPTAPLGAQDPPGAAGLLVDPNLWRARSKRPLRAAPGARRHYLVPPIGEPLRLDSRAELIVLGRDEECDIVIASPQVSRRHVEITFHDEKPHVRDLGTMNGTRVNDLPVREPHALFDGDVVRFGDVMATYRVLESGQPTSSLRPASAKKTANDTVPITRGGALSGNLALIPIADLLAQLAKSKANGVLHVESDSDGTIAFVDGEVKEVRLGEKKSASALQELQRLKRGIFRFEPK